MCDYVVLPLLNSSFEPGRAREVVEGFVDVDLRNIARAELFYFTGQAEECCEITRGYLSSRVIELKLSACILYGYSNLTLGNVAAAKRGMEGIQSCVKIAMKKKVPKDVYASCLLAGAGVFLYPTISDMWNQYRNAQLVSKYEEAVTELSDNDYDRLWKEAKEYNAEHPVNAIVDAFEEEDTYELSHPYDRVLDPNGDGLMGSIEIPKIKARLAIYHGLSKTVLEKGVGHVEGTSLPIGGRSTHAVLAAHRGLPNAKLFTDLDQMEKGDIFILHILGKHLAYKVDQIKTVLPDETSDLDIIEGEDHVTLITCTPYGVNTHRLLVRGVRTKYVVEDTKNDETIPQKLAVVDPKRVLAGGAAVLVVLILLIYLIVRHRDKKRKKKQLSERKEEAESDEK